ncbi:alpha/beta fold hydrolase [uncultured Tateyamaria sp.]|uniref:alpha/beta hydrolase n=1 Tax=uncultured Tateyamaria sp. TaxID=455651 RepID=UPI00261D135A|nr:alpha/beta fold hydrolase [uncultured Tateyamaria sp.]
MRRFGKILGWVLLGLIVLIGASWLFGPYEDATLTPRPEAVMIDGDLDAHFAAVEAAYEDITPGVEKRVIWAGQAGAKTPWSILYVHGFSATSEEIRPVPDAVAESLGANLIYTRLQGHGRGPEAMAEGTVQGWVDDLAEGIAAARVAGEKVLIISTSTGGTLVAATAQNEALMEDVAGLVFVSPNFGINNPLATLLTWPAARYWLPSLAGERRSFEPSSEAHGRYWTTEYASVAVLPMAVLIQATMAMDHGAQTLPALFWYATDDRVVRPDITAEVAAAWGGDAQVINPVMGEGDDPLAHVATGDIMSPGQTERAVIDMLAFVRELDP